MSNRPSGYIPGSDLPFAEPGTSDSVIGVDRSSGGLRQFGVGSIPLNPALKARLDSLEVGQASGMVAYPTKAAMESDFASRPIGSAGLVTNDPNPDNNGAYRRGGSSWGKAADRTSVLGAKVDGLELNRFAFRESLSGDADLNTISRNGVYYGGAGNGYTGLPPGFDGSSAFNLFVYNIVAEAGRWQYQELHTFEPGDLRVWRRVLDQNNPTSSNRPWYFGYVHDGEVTGPKIAAGAIHSEKLTVGYSYRGIPPEGSANDVTASGLYIVQGGLTDLPVGAPDGGLLEVRNYSYSSGSYVIQTYTDTVDAGERWQRTLRAPQAIFNPWVRLGIADSRWSGQTWNVLGDSITAGTGDSGGASGTYWAQLSEQMAFGNVRNYGIGGTAIAVRAAPWDTNAMCIRYADMDNDADLVTVMGGTNDWRQVPLGDITDTAPTTFYGALGILVRGLMEKYPAATIAFLRPIPRRAMFNETTGAPLTDADGNTFPMFTQAINEVCGQYGIPVIDLFNGTSIRPWDEDNKTAFIPDGLHPNVAGYALMARAIRARLQAL